MSTHAAIIAAGPNGTYRGIYVHADGYPDHTGRILKENYTTDEAVTALIDLGDLSLIGEWNAPAEGQAHSFREPAPGVTIAYHRDRGEAKRIASGTDLKKVAGRISWNYLYLWEGGEWVTFENEHELHDEIAQRLAWEIERAESEAGWDPNP
jgi:hypothetical protein